jgi:hypothetical protein
MKWEGSTDGICDFLHTESLIPFLTGSFRFVTQSVYTGSFPLSRVWCSCMLILRSCVGGFCLPVIVVCVHHNLEIRLWFLADDICTPGAACHPVEFEKGKSDGEDEDSDFCDKLHCPPTLNFHPHHYYIRNLPYKVALFIRALHKKCRYILLQTCNILLT